MKIIMIVVPSTRKTAMIECALNLTAEVRKKGDAPLARCLDRELEDTPTSIEEMRSLERALIRSKSVDAVIFADGRPDGEIVDASYVALRAVARQYQYVP